LKGAERKEPREAWFSEEPGCREGAGTIDYLIFIKVFPRPGWLILFFLLVNLRETRTSSTDKILYALIITEEQLCLG
jgi:hypothetical protein